jgi:hypothetical protein
MKLMHFNFGSDTSSAIVRRIALATILSVCSLTCALCQDQKDLLDPADTTTAIDLKDLPKKMEGFREFALWVQEYGTKNRFQDEFQQFQSDIAKSLANNADLGYLLKVRLYVNPEGATDVPGGQLLAFSGVGKTPIDALARFRMSAGITAPDTLAPPFENQSYYLWIKNENGKLKAGFVPREMRDALENGAEAEVHRRRELEKVYEAMDSSGAIGVAKDKFWSDLAQKSLASLRDDGQRRKINGLVKEFAAAHQRFDQTYQEFLQKEQELREQQQRLQTLQTLSRVVGIVSTAIQAGEMSSPDSKTIPVKASPGDGQDPTEVMIQYHEKQIDMLRGEIYEWGQKIEIRGATLEKVNTELIHTFQNNGVHISDSDQKLELPTRH